MRSGFMYALLSLLRLDYSIFSASGLIVAGVLSSDLRGFQSEYIVAFFIVLFSAAGSFSFNDFFDYEVDCRNDRVDRPLVLGLLPRKVALASGIIFFLASILLSLMLNPLARILVWLSLPVFYLYSLGGKKYLLFKNVVIAFAYVVTILLGSLVSDGYIEPLIAYFAARARCF